MIQRIQTLWLLAASGSAFATLKLPFYNGHKIGDALKTYQTLNATSTIPITVLAVSVAVISLLLVFLYKDRSLQIKIAFATLAGAILTLVLYFLEVKKFIPGEGEFALTAAFAFLIPVFILLAIRGMIKDEKLIKSVDRLR